MANVDRPRGFTPVGKIDGSPFNGVLVRCTVVAADADVIAIGDAVEQVTTGADLAGSGEPNEGGTFPIVSRCDLGTDRVTGVVVSVEPNRADLSAVTSTASTDRQVMIALATHDTVFECQHSGTPGVAGVWGCYDMAIGAPSNGRSIMEIDGAAGTTGVWRLIGFVNSPDNDPTLANPACLVVVAESTLGDASTGAGLA